MNQLEGAISKKGSNENWSMVLILTHIGCSPTEKELFQIRMYC